MWTVIRYLPKIANISHKTPTVARAPEIRAIFAKQCRYLVWTNIPRQTPGGHDKMAKRLPRIQPQY